MSKNKTEYIDVTSDEVRSVIDGIAQAIDKMVDEFRTYMNVMEQISRLLKESPPNIELVRFMLERFFDVDDPNEEDD